MNFKVYIIGDKISKFYSDAIKEYEKRLSRYCKIELISVKNIDQLLKKISDKSYKIVISASGQQISSEELAKKINNFGISGNSDLSIVIGNENIDFDENLAIGPMDMNLGLKATIIFEQIYRGYRIINNEPYHK
jgi:23S rRNA (pseudouridine1915-N3)-methyltransferase